MPLIIQEWERVFCAAKIVNTNIPKVLMELSMPEGVPWMIFSALNPHSLAESSSSFWFQALTLKLPSFTSASFSNLLRISSGIDPQSNTDRSLPDTSSDGAAGWSVVSAKSKPAATGSCFGGGVVLHVVSV